MSTHSLSNDMSLDQAILNLTGQHTVPDQATLLKLLDKEGFTLTQSTLSRRLAKLNVEKRDGQYQRVVPHHHPMPPYSVHECPPNLLVLTTGPGFGMALAVRVDRSKLPAVAGTVAGEDTLFVATAPGYTLSDARAQVEKVLGAPARP